MTLSDLKKYRLAAPHFVAFVGLIPCFSLSSFSKRMAGLETTLLLTVSAALVAVLYAATRLGKRAWNKEIAEHIGPQIRRRLLALIPQDLAVSEEERLVLSSRDVFKKLTGVFWEAIDADAQLAKHKEHFYSNGLLYSGAIDAAYVMTLLSAGYLVSYWWTDRFAWYLSACACIALASLSQWRLLPYYREEHKKLSREQLDLLELNQRAFVQDRFRAIVTRRRSGQGLE